MGTHNRAFTEIDWAKFDRCLAIAQQFQPQALPLLRRLERLGLELEQPVERPQAQEQWARYCSIFREVEETTAQLQALTRALRGEA